MNIDDASDLANGSYNPTPSALPPPSNSSPLVEWLESLKQGWFVFWGKFWGL